MMDELETHWENTIPSAMNEYPIAMSDEALVWCAEELFLILDAHECETSHLES